MIMEDDLAIALRQKGNTREWEITGRKKKIQVKIWEKDLEPLCRRADKRNARRNREWNMGTRFYGKLMVKLIPLAPRMQVDSATFKSAERNVPTSTLRRE